LKWGPRVTLRGREFLEPPILTTPQCNPWSLFQYGGIEVEGVKKSTVGYSHS